MYVVHQRRREFHIFPRARVLVHGHRVIILHDPIDTAHFPRTRDEFSATQRLWLNITQEVSSGSSFLHVSLRSLRASSAEESTLGRGEYVHHRPAHQVRAFALTRFLFFSGLIDGHSFVDS